METQKGEEIKELNQQIKTLTETENKLTKKVEKKDQALNKLTEVLGTEIKNLDWLTEILEGKSLKELKQEQLLKENRIRQEQQEQLRKINLLFDENAINYETIDFNGLYELLVKFNQEQEENKKLLDEKTKEYEKNIKELQSKDNKLELRKISEEKRQLCEYLSGKFYHWLKKKKQRGELTEFPTLWGRKKYDELFVDVLLRSWEKMSKSEQKAPTIFNSCLIFGEGCAQRELDSIMPKYFQDKEETDT